MTSTMRWIARHCLPALLFIPIGCSSAPQSVTSPESRAVASETRKVSDVDAENASALQRLEQNSSMATDAIKAIDIARDVALHNLSNAQTTAFKGSRAILQEGGKVRIERDFSQGRLQDTGQPLDLSIQGDGFFKVQLDKADGNQIGYTRNGEFFVSATGNLVLAAGDDYVLLPPITIPNGATNVTISQEGVVWVLKPGATSRIEIGRVTLSTFMNLQGLKPLENGIFLATETSGKPTDNEPEKGGASVLLEGFLEGSNVDITRETVRLHFLNEWRAALMQAMGMHT